MEIHHLDASLIRQAFLAGAAELDAKKDWINELNVFPVPDGDTGSNMTLTIMTAAKAVAELEDPDMHTLCKAISSGSLRGARGNSGVILSQLLRGFTKEIDGEEEEIGIPRLAAALERATETAYKAVMKPKEGTILTVARAMSDAAMELSASGEETDVLKFAAAVVEAGDEALARTPELLPVLKQAGVVDSGGQGLMAVVKGAVRGLEGRGVPLPAGDDEGGLPSGAPAPGSVDSSRLDTAEIRFGYCTEFIIKLEKPMEEEEETAFKAYLESIGDSIVCVVSDEIVKIHVHTDNPGLAIQRGLSYGPLSRMKIDNMREEHNERLIRNASRIAAEEKQRKEEKKAAERKAYGFACVSAGKGLDRIFQEIGVDATISGGQTMNPSTEDILNAISGINADTVFVLPNNKNIILASEQAGALAEGKRVLVVPTRTIPQGISALISFMPDLSPEENLEAMRAAAESVRSAEVTYAVRDTSIDGFQISRGDFMAIGERGMLTVEKTPEAAVLGAIEKLSEGSAELVTLYYGEGVEKGDAEKLLELVSQRFPDAEIELNDGGQPVYCYFISVE